MKHYLNPTDQRVYAYPADGSFDENIPTDYVLLSESEAQIKLKDYIKI